MRVQRAVAIVWHGQVLLPVLLGRDCPRARVLAHATRAIIAGSESSATLITYEGTKLSPDFFAWRTPPPVETAIVA